MANGRTGNQTAGGAALPGRFAATAAAVDAALVAEVDAWLGEAPAGLAEAIRYAVLGPGKRIRPVLLLWASQLCGGGVAGVGSPAMTTAVAVELLHTYSLVHDDLPAMDDDDLRRGRPTCHVVYGEGHAVLVGDALLTRAFELLAGVPLPAERVVRLVSVLGRAAGAGGMVGGQSQDLACEQAGAGQRPAGLAEVDYIHERKTAALIAACCRMGAVAAGADRPVELALESFGRSLGLTFQIADDLLDELHLADRLGKNTGQDRAVGKLTYPAVMGVQASRLAGEQALAKALAALDEGAGLLVERRAEASIADIASLLSDLRAVGRYVIDRTQ